MRVVTCDYVVDELHRKFQEKFPERITELESFLYSVMDIINVVKTPREVGVLPLIRLSKGIY